MSHSETIGECLFNALTDGGQASLDELFAAVNRFRTNANRSFEGVRRQPFARAILDAIADADRYMNDRP